MRQNNFIILSLLTALLYGTAVLAQVQTDTVYVSPERTSSVIVPGMVVSVDVGNKSFLAQVQKNSVLIKPELTTPAGQSTSIHIQFTDSVKGFEYFSALLVCDDAPGKPFYYDLRPHFSRDKRESGFTEAEKQKRYLERIKKKIALVENRPIDIRDIGEFKENIIMLLRNIGMDDKNLYLRFEVQNNSTIDFNIATVDLSYVKRLEKGLFKKAELQREPVSMQWGDTPVKVIPGGRAKTVSFALPVYGIKSNDYLQVMFREQAGNRHLEFNVYGKTITRHAKYILLEEEKYRQ